jgi:hypothetical protein
MPRSCTPRARAAPMGDDAEQSRQRAQYARGAGERDGETGKGGRRLSRGAEGKDARARAAPMGGDADDSRQCAQDTRDSDFLDGLLKQLCNAGSRPLSTIRQPCRNTVRAWTRRKPLRHRRCANCSTTPTATTTVRQVPARAAMACRPRLPGSAKMMRVGVAGIVCGGRGRVMAAVADGRFVGSRRIAP